MRAAAVGGLARHELRPSVEGFEEGVEDEVGGIADVRRADVTGVADL